MTPDSSNSSEGESPAEKVHIDHPFEVREWSHRLNVTVDALEQAIRIVGPALKDIRRFLGK